MPSLIKLHLKERTRPEYGMIDIRRKFIWWPRVLPAPSLKGKMQLRWLGVERIIYEYKTWKKYVPEIGECDTCGWRAREWYW